MRSPLNFKAAWAAALALLISATLTGCGGGGSTAGAAGPLPSLALFADPAFVKINPGTTFDVKIKALETGTTAAPTFTLGSLPAGLTTNAALPMAIPSTGATIAFTAASSIPTGNYSIPLTGAAGQASANASVAVTIAAGQPSPAYFVFPLFQEVSLVQGGSSSLQFQILGDSTFEISLGAVGLPSGVSATFTPPVVQAGDTFSVTLNASGNAPAAQNVEWTLVGTPGANVPPALLHLVLDVTLPSGVGWTNRTDYLSTRATPFSAVYDPAHQLIFSSNQTWNRIDVISNLTHTLQQSIPILDPRGLDISINGTTVWVATGSQLMYGIDTTTLKTTRYQLPRITGSSFPISSWEGGKVFSLADGTVLLIFSGATGDGSEYAAIWDPASNALTPKHAPTGGAFPAQWQIVTRSGDGKRIFSIGGNSDETCFSYDVLSGTFSVPLQLGNYGFSAVANPDGSRVAITDSTNGFNLYDNNFQRIGPLPGSGFSPGGGGVVFSPDGSTMYEEVIADNIPLIVTVNVATRQPTALAPAMPIVPVMTELSFGYYIPQPFAVDSAGMLLGIEYQGIAFDDAMAHIDFVTNQSGSPVFMQHMSPYSGPLSGGTASSGFGNGFSLKPDVYYGANKGTATLSQTSLLRITSPPASASGPVNIKMLFPNGIEVFNPRFFTYGTTIQDLILNGAGPEGGAPGKLDAFGLPDNPGLDTVTIGANRATVTSTQGQYPPLTDEQTAMFLSYTVPAGLPGWADVAVKTPNGTGTLRKGFFYAQSVTDYSSPDSFSYVLYDKSRNRLYLSAGDHIDVFSLASNSFGTALHPAAIGTTKQFQGLALTPDGKYLLAADLLDGSLAVMDADVPSNSYAVSVAPSTSFQGCAAGPLFVAADNQGHAFVVTGGVVGATGCGPGGQTYVVNLAARTSAMINLPGCGASSGFVRSTADGSMVGFGAPLQLFSTAQQRCLAVPVAYMLYGIAAAGDGNVFATARGFVDSSGNIIGRMGHPTVFYPSPSSYYNASPYDDGALQNPALNDSGSLYYWAYPDHVDVVDVQHGMSRLRFALSEKVSNAVAPIAIDGGGQHIYLITNKSLTIVDLGQALLSVGSLSQSTAAAGTQVVLRGSGFENGITVAVGTQSASVSYTDSNTLTFTVPPAAVGMQDLILKNPDGTSYTLENALRVQ